VSLHPTSQRENRALEFVPDLSRGWAFKSQEKGAMKPKDLKAKDFLYLGVFILLIVIVVIVIRTNELFFAVAGWGCFYSWVAMLGFIIISSFNPLRSFVDRIGRLTKRYGVHNFIGGVFSTFVISFFPALMLRLKSVPLSFWFIVIFIIGVVYELIVMEGGYEDQEIPRVAHLEAILGCVVGTILGLAIGNIINFKAILNPFLNVISPHQMAPIMISSHPPEIFDVELIEDMTQGTLIIYQDISFIDQDGDARSEGAITIVLVSGP
jgi:hypothetical protein